MIAPTRAHSTLAGADAALPTTRVASRTFGIREIYVGGSVVVALRFAPRAVTPLLLAGVVINAWDTAAFALTSHLPGATRRGGIAVAGGFTIAGAAAAISSTLAQPQVGSGRETSAAASSLLTPNARRT